MEKTINEINAELRNVSEALKNGTMEAAEARGSIDNIKAQKRAVEQRIAGENRPDTRDSGVSGVYADIASAMREQRKITLGGTGAVNTVKGLIKEASLKIDFLKDVKIFTGANSETRVTILSPTVARPESVPGTDSVTEDQQARLVSKVLTPKPFVSEIGVSLSALTLGTADIEKELPGIFADAYAEGWARQIMTGSGINNDFEGLFVNVPAKNTVQSKGNRIRLADLAMLSLQRREFNDACIVVSPTVFAEVISDDTPESAVYKQELIFNEKIHGVRVLITSFAPSGEAEGSTVAVAGRLQDYGMAVAGELQLTPIFTRGTTTVSYQAAMFANGCKIVENDFWQLTRGPAAKSAGKSEKA